MEFQIKTADGKELELAYDIPPEYLKLILPKATATCITGSFGCMLFQNIKSEGFDIWCSHYFIKKPATFSCLTAAPSLELHCMLKNNWHTLMKGLGIVTVKQNQFNMTYLPFIDCITSFEVGEYTTFDIHYSAVYLDKYALMQRVLTPFLENVSKGIPCHLLASHAFASAQMRQVIQQLLHSNYHDELQNIYYDIKAAELLLLALRKANTQSGGNGKNLSEKDVTKMHHAKAWLDGNFSKEVTLASIARAVSTNEFILKKGFKELFGTTVFHYLRTVRMEKARQLLKDTNTPINEVAYLTGYGSQAAFTASFTNHFGFTPMQSRKEQMS